MADPLPGPVRSQERTLAPDLARGAMLLLIVVANTPWYLWGRERSGVNVHPDGGTWLDQVTQAFIITAVDSRVYPMFAFLFGYGIVQLFQRQAASGTSEKAARALLQRRNLWLLAFGFVHAALLWMGDILGAYGVAGLVLVWLFLRRRDGTLLLWSGLGVVLLLLMTAMSALGALAAAMDPAGAGTTETFNPIALGVEINGESDLLAAAGQRMAFWAFLVFFQGLLTITVPVAILLGFWAARHRILEEPHRHLPLLRGVAAVGIAIAWLGGGLHAAAHLGVLPLPEEAMFLFSTTQLVTGLAGGVGYVALFGLIGHWLSGRGTGLVATSVAAVGKRSLSCYLAQSLLCAPVLAAWGLGLGGQMHSAAMAGYAVAVWLATVAGAYALERAGRRGPAEVLLRRLAYRRPAGISRSRPADG